MFKALNYMNNKRKKNLLVKTLISIVLFYFNKLNLNILKLVFTIDYFLSSSLLAYSSFFTHSPEEFIFCRHIPDSGDILQQSPGLSLNSSSWPFINNFKF